MVLISLQRKAASDSSAGYLKYTILKFSSTWATKLCKRSFVVVVDELSCYWSRFYCFKFRCKGMDLGHSKGSKAFAKPRTNHIKPHSIKSYSRLTKLISCVQNSKKNASRQSHQSVNMKCKGGLLITDEFQSFGSLGPKKAALEKLAER